MNPIKFQGLCLGVEMTQVIKIQFLASNSSNVELGGKWYLFFFCF
jgi:hypothetical protein